MSQVIWNPREVLNLFIGADRFNCVGVAHSKGGSRCGWEIERNRCTTANNMLRSMAEIHPSSIKIAPHLSQLANSILCTQVHQYQAQQVDNKVQVWSEKISLVANQMGHIQQLKDELRRCKESVREQERNTPKHEDEIRKIKGDLANMTEKYQRAKKHSLTLSSQVDRLQSQLEDSQELLQDKDNDLRVAIHTQRTSIDQESVTAGKLESVQARLRQSLEVNVLQKSILGIRESTISEINRALSESQELLALSLQDQKKQKDVEADLGVTIQTHKHRIEVLEMDLKRVDQELEDCDTGPVVDDQLKQDRERSKVPEPNSLAEIQDSQLTEASPPVSVKRILQLKKRLQEADVYNSRLAGEVDDMEEKLSTANLQLQALT